MEAKISPLLRKILKDPEGREKLQLALLSDERPTEFEWNGKKYVLRSLGSVTFGPNFFQKLVNYDQQPAPFERFFILCGCFRN